MCPLMQILAGSHCKRNFKCGLCTNFALHVHGILWTHGAVSYVLPRWMWGFMHLVQCIHLRGVYSDHPQWYVPALAKYEWSCSSLQSTLRCLDHQVVLSMDLNYTGHSVYASHYTFRCTSSKPFWTCPKLLRYFPLSLRVEARVS
jgi:hypothetical protein